MAARLLDEGHEVLVWHDWDDNNWIGRGIFPIESSWEGLLEWASQEPESIVLFDASGMGKKADEARDRGLLVVGGGTFCDRLETDRAFGSEVAAEAGAMIPQHEAFASLSEVKERAKSIGAPVYFKTDTFVEQDATQGCDDGAELLSYMDELRERGVPDKTKCMLQEKIDGTAISTGRWWNGNAWAGPYCWDLERKALLNGDKGPSTGCAFNAVWFTPESSVAEGLGWEALALSFRREEAPPGWYDINSVIDEDGTPWFLEWTPRLGYDSEPTGFRLVDHLGSLLWAVATGQGWATISDEIAYSFRLYVPPYPWESVKRSDKKTCIGTHIDGADGLWDKHFIPYQVEIADDGIMKVASPEGCVGLSLAVGKKLSALGKETLEYADDDLSVAGLGYRTDGHEKVKQDAAKLKESGVKVHPGLLE
jgi:hypothetical protein